MEQRRSSAAKGQIIYSTSEGRQRFADILQVTFGDKTLVAFDRYGRALGALVPIEAVKMIAEWEGSVDARLRDHIKAGAETLLDQIGEVRPNLRQSLKAPAAGRDKGVSGKPKPPAPER